MPLDHEKIREHEGLVVMISGSCSCSGQGTFTAPIAYHEKDLWLASLLKQPTRYPCRQESGHKYECCWRVARCEGGFVDRVR